MLRKIFLSEDILYGKKLTQRQLSSNLEYESNRFPAILECGFGES